MTEEKREVTVTPKSIDSTIPKVSFNESLKEYIQNSFDAKASQVEVSFTRNILGGIDEVIVRDNGDGIPYEELNKTLDPFLDSPKKNYSRSSYVKGRKGKGRFYFKNFSSAAKWVTVYEKDNNMYCYSISMKEGSKEYKVTKPKIIKNMSKGTEITFTSIHTISNFTVVNCQAAEYLAVEFGWFLFLNRDKNYQITYDEKIIDYEQLIEKNVNEEFNIEDHNFKINYIQWNKKIGDKYYYYLINSNRDEKIKKLTSFNNLGLDFHHSVFIESDFFNDYQFCYDDDLIDNMKPKKQLNLNKPLNNEVFMEVYGRASNILTTQKKEFIKEDRANKLIRDYERKKIIPEFQNKQYYRKRKEDLINVIKQIYIIQPLIFNKLKDQQAKTLVGFLNLLLDTDSRDEIFNLLSGYLEMTEMERKDLNNILKSTSLSRITRTIKLIKNRLTVIETLKVLIYNLEKFTNERDHIQKIIESNYWLFGEQYHLVSADKGFNKLLSNYTHFLDYEEEKNILKSDESRKRPDIFLCTRHNVPSNNDVIQENIIVELKRPNVKIGKKEFQQIENYKDFIIQSSEFNSVSRKWKFLLIGKDVDEFIKNKYKTAKTNTRLLVETNDENYEIYVMTWDDIFTGFDIKSNYLLSKLELDKEVIEEELGLKTINVSKQEAKRLTGLII